MPDHCYWLCMLYLELNSFWVALPKVVAAHFKNCLAIEQYLYSNFVLKQHKCSDAEVASVSEIFRKSHMETLAHISGEVRFEKSSPYFHPISV